MLRRQFLQTLLAGSGALASGLVPSAMAAPSAAVSGPALVWLKTGMPFERELGAGLGLEAVRELRSLSLAGDTLRRPLQLARLLTDLKGQVLVGLVADSDFVILQEMVRHTDGCLLMHGQHLWSLEGDSRHAFFTTARARGVSTQLAQVLKPIKGAEVVSEAALGPEVVTANLVNGALGGLAAGNWPSVLGQALARVGTGRWRIQSPLEARPVSGRAPWPLAGSAVSFVIAV